MKLIQDHQRHALQHRVVLKHARQHAFGHHFQSRLWPDAAFAAHPESHRRPWLLAELLRQPLRYVARRQPPWLQHNDPPWQRRLL